MTTPFSTRASVEHIMGIPVSLHVRARDTGREDIAAAIATAFDTMRAAEAVFSTWRSDSDVMRWRAGELDIADAHQLLPEVHSLCVSAALATDGLFTADLVGPDGTRGFDPTGVVKAWAVDTAAESLRGLGHVAFSINAGGDILCGTGRDGESFGPWRIGIEDPIDRSHIARVVETTTGAVATSSCAARGAHIVDPRTDTAVQQQFSTTVVGPSLVWADIWATATFVDPTALDEREDWSGYRLIVTGR